MYTFQLHKLTHQKMVKATQAVHIKVSLRLFASKFDRLWLAIACSSLVRSIVLLPHNNHNDKYNGGNEQHHNNDNSNDYA